MGQEIKIRLMRKEDCEAVRKIECACFSIPWSLESIEEVLQYETHQFLVAEVNDEVVGYMGMIKTIDEADVTNVAVLPHMRKKGIGELLVRESLKRAKEEQVNTVFLEVRESNAGAIRLYEKFHFIPISMRKNYYKDPLENAVIMSANLSTIK